MSTLFWVLSMYVEWNDGESKREIDRQRQKDRPMGELLLEATWPHITSETCRCRRHCCLTKWTETQAQTLHTPCYCKLLHGSPEYLIRIGQCKHSVVRYFWIMTAKLYKWLSDSTLYHLTPHTQTITHNILTAIKRKLMMWKLEEIFYDIKEW